MFDGGARGRGVGTAKESRWPEAGDEETVEAADQREYRLYFCALLDDDHREEHRTRKPVHCCAESKTRNRSRESFTDQFPSIHIEIRIAIRNFDSFK